MDTALIQTLSTIHRQLQRTIIQFSLPIYRIDVDMLKSHGIKVDLFTFAPFSYTKAAPHLATPVVKGPILAAMLSRQGVTTNSVIKAPLDFEHATVYPNFPLFGSPNLMRHTIQ